MNVLIRVAGFVCAVGVASMLASCATADPATSSGSRSPSTSSELDTSTSSAPSSDEYDPTDPMTWPISFDRIGPIGVGDDVATAESRMKALAVGDFAMCPGNWDAHSQRGSSVILWFSLDSNGNAVAVEAIQIAVFRSSIADASAATTQGVGIRSTLDEVARVYPGGRLETGDSEAAGYDYQLYLVDQDGRELTFGADPLFLDAASYPGAVDRVTLSATDASWNTCE